jgi:hypothetical protein
MFLLLKINTGLDALRFEAECVLQPSVPHLLDKLARL